MRWFLFCVFAYLYALPSKLLMWRGRRRLRLIRLPGDWNSGDVECDADPWVVEYATWTVDFHGPEDVFPATGVFEAALRSGGWRFRESPEDQDFGLSHLFTSGCWTRGKYVLVFRVESWIPKSPMALIDVTMLHP